MAKEKAHTTQKAAKEQRKKKFMFDVCIMNGKQVRVKRPTQLMASTSVNSSDEMQTHLVASERNARAYR